MFGGAKAWADRKINKKPCKVCGVVFQPSCGGNKYCTNCVVTVKKKNHAAGQRNWRARDPKRHAITKVNWDLKKYGISILEYERLLVEQRGKCAICETEDPGGRGVHRRFAVDHCHKTMRIRGLLCPLCNTGLGLFNDNTQRLAQAILYLGK